MKTKSQSNVIRILFVCEENTCRSPMLEAMAQHALDLKYPGRFQCLSAGTDVKNPKLIIEYAKDAVKEISYGKITSTHSQSIKDINLETVDLIVPVDEFKEWLIKEENKNLAERVRRLTLVKSGLKDIPDPFNYKDFQDDKRKEFEDKIKLSVSAEEKENVKYEQYRYVASLMKEEFMPRFLEIVEEKFQLQNSKPGSRVAPDGNNKLSCISCNML
jgi:protein-tyrosine-phosphatase